MKNAYKYIKYSLKITVQLIIVFIFLLIIIIRCSPTYPALNYSIMKGKPVIAFVKDKEKLCLFDPNIHKSKVIDHFPDKIIALKWSPDGNKLAIVAEKYGDDGGLFDQETENSYKLYVIDSLQFKNMFLKNDKTSAQNLKSGKIKLYSTILDTLVNFSIVNKDTEVFSEYIKHYTIDVYWTSESDAILYFDHNGISKIGLDGKCRQLINSRFIEDIEPVAGKNKLAFSIKDSLAILDLDAFKIEPVINSLDSLKVNYDSTISNISFSGDQSKIAFTFCRMIIVYDLSNNMLRVVGKYKEPVLWLDWLHDNNDIVYLSGLTVSYSSYSSYDGTTVTDNGNFQPRFSTKTRKNRGYFFIEKISINDSGTTRLFKKGEDAGTIYPQLSEDGKMIVLTTNPLNAVRKLFILGTNDPGILQLNYEGVCSLPKWKPVSH